MTIQDIVNKLDIDKSVPVHYHIPLENSLLGQFYCKFISEKEVDDYKNNSWKIKDNYNNSSLGLYLPDSDTETAYKYEMNRNNTSVNETITELSFIEKVPIDKKHLFYCIYAILHETGHWVHFKNSGLSNLEFAKEMNDSKNAIIEPYGSNVHSKKYKLLPHEKIATDYAMNNFLLYYNKVIKKV